MGIPRLDCLGLIEAGGDIEEVEEQQWRFRGLIASASLKPLSVQWHTLTILDSEA